jgi:hypothetical protein
VSANGLDLVQHPAAVVLFTLEMERDVNLVLDLAAVIAAR